MSSELRETETTLDNITRILYEANKPADTLAKKFGDVASNSRKMTVLMRFLSGSGAWKFLNKVRAVAQMVQGYYINLENANKELRESAKNYAEQIHNLSQIADLYEEGTTQLDLQKVAQSDIYKGLEDMYGEAYAFLKIQEMTDEAYANQYDKLEKLKRSNMQNADIVKAIAEQEKTGRAGRELIEEAERRGLGKMKDGKFEEFTGVKKFFSMRWRKLVNAGIYVGGLIKSLGKIVLDYVKAGAKIFMMGLLYIGMFLFLLILAKPFIVRMMEAANDIRKTGSSTLHWIGVFWTNFKERFAVVWKALSNFVSVLFDKEKGFEETIAAYFQLVYSVLKFVIGTLWDLVPVAISIAMELLVILIKAGVKLLFNLGEWIGQKLMDMAIWTKDWLWEKITWLGDYIKGRTKQILGAAVGGAIGFVVTGGNPLGAVAGAAVGGSIAGGMATGGIAGLSGKNLGGEKGPEIVSLPRGAKVTPNHQIRNTGGNTIHVHVSGRVGASDQEIRDIARKVGAQVSREINRTTSSGMRA